MKIFADSCKDFFLRGILGRYGRMEFTLFQYEKGLTFHDVVWSVVGEKKALEVKPAASPSVSIGKKVANCVGTLCDRVLHGGKPKPEEGNSKSSNQQLPAPEPSKEYSGDAENQFLDLVARIEMLMGTRLIKWANGRNLPSVNLASRISSMPLAELEQVVVNGPCSDSARDERLIRQAISNLNAFMVSGVRASISRQLVDSHVTTQIELASLESMAFRIGIGELEDVERIYDFYDEVVRIMMRRGLGEFLQLYVDQGFLDKTFLSRYRSSNQKS